MPAQFSLLLAKLAILAATTGAQPGGPEEDGLVPGTLADLLPVLDDVQFATVRTAMPESGFSYFVYCYLLDVEFHLEEIARARVAKDFASVARKARVLADTAADIGVLRASAAARRLEEACRAGEYRQTNALIGALNQRCTEAEMELRGFLAEQVRLSGAA